MERESDLAWLLAERIERARRWARRPKRSWSASELERAVGQGGRASRQARRYRVTESEFRRLAEEQGGRCAICRREPAKLCIDHDHLTGVVRGLLCYRCNSALPFVEDSQRLAAALAYLERVGGAAA